MRKPDAAAFGTRGKMPTTPAVQIPVTKPKWRVSGGAVANTRYGLIIKIAIALWVLTILAVMFWPQG